MEHPQMNPPTTDTQRLRVLLAAATPGIVEAGDDGTNDLILVIEETTQTEIVLFVSDESTREDRDLFIALRNEAPALLDEIDRLRDTAARLRYYHEQKETENRQIYEEVSELETKLRRECESHSATTAERDKLREEVKVERIATETACEIISGIESRLGVKFTGYPPELYDAIDSLRRENEELKAKIEKGQS